MINGISGMSVYTRTPYYGMGAGSWSSNATAARQAVPAAQSVPNAAQTAGAQKASGGVWTASAQRAPSPETPVQPVNAVSALRGGEQSSARLGLPVQLGADPVEMAVRMRIQYVDPADLKPSSSTASAAQGSADGVSIDEQLGAEGAQAAVEEGECQTCKARKYQDESDDMGVSFQTPTNIAPEQAASAVRGHEMEHVVREQAKAEREDRRVVSQNVVIHTAICPECGKAYVSGGTTTTVTAADNRAVEAASAQDAAAQKEESERRPFSAVA